MTITRIYTDGTLYVSALPSGPITKMQWYRTRTCTGLLVVFRRSTDGAAESVTFTTQIGGRMRRLRVIYPFRR